MKKTLVVLLSVVLALSIVTGCSDRKSSTSNSLGATAKLREDIPGFWYEEDSGLLVEFKGNEYSLGFVDGFSDTGTFNIISVNVNSDTIVLHSSDIGDSLKWTSAKIRNDVLSFTTEADISIRMERISEDEARSMLE